MANRGKNDLSVIEFNEEPKLNYHTYGDNQGQFYAEHVGSAQQCADIIHAYNNDTSDYLSEENTQPEGETKTTSNSLSASKEAEYMATIHDLRKSLTAARSQLIRYKELLAKSNNDGILIYLLIVMGKNDKNNRSLNLAGTSFWIIRSRGIESSPGYSPVISNMFIETLSIFNFFTVSIGDVFPDISIILYAVPF